MTSLPLPDVLPKDVLACSMECPPLSRSPLPDRPAGEGRGGSQEQKKSGGAADEGWQVVPVGEHPYIRKTERLGAGAASGAEGGKKSSSGRQGQEQEQQVAGLGLLTSLWEGREDGTSSSSSSRQGILTAGHCTLHCGPHQQQDKVAVRNNTN